MPQIIHKTYYVLQQPIVAVVDSSSAIAADTIGPVISPSIADSVRIPDNKDWFAFQSNPDSLLAHSRQLFANDSLSVSVGESFGFAGKPLGVDMVNSTAIQSVLLGALVMTTFAASMGYKYFEQLLRNFFQVKERVGFFSENSVVGLGFKSSLAIQALILESVVVYHLMRLVVFEEVLRSGFLIGMLWFLVSFVIYHAIRLLMISSVTSVFSDSRTVNSYISEYFTVLGFWGIALFPVALLLVYSSVSPLLISVFLSVLILIGRISYFNKGIKIFFIQNRSIFYIILYLCALEILPLVALFQVLIYIYSITR